MSSFARIVMAALWNRAGHYIFMLWFLSSYSIYLSSFLGPVRQNPIQRTVRFVQVCVHCTVHNCCAQYCT